MGQAPISVELTPELVEKTLLLWAKEGVFNGLVESSTKESPTPNRDAIDAFFELIEQGQVVDESDSSSDSSPVLSDTSAPNPVVTVEVNQNGAQTTDQAPKARKAAKTSPVETVKKTASKSKTTKKLSSNTSRKQRGSLL